MIDSVWMLRPDEENAHFTLLDFSFQMQEYTRALMQYAVMVHNKKSPQL